MAYTYLDNIELEEALKKYMDVLKDAGAAPREELIPVTKSLGRITWEAVYARISSPHYNASAMDGISLYAKSTFGASETTPVRLVEGRDYVKVDTGDPLPGSFDAVVMIEEVIDAGGGRAMLISPAVPWQHIRQIGEDLCAGEMILTSGAEVTPAAIGALLAGGVTELKVIRKPLVGIIPTGDEVIPPTDNPGEGKVMEFNSSVFSAMLSHWGAEAKVYDIVPDKVDMLKASVLSATEECDVVIINAGSSAGREDYSSQIISELGRRVIHGIAIRPGKPTILGLVNNRPVIGVPGYPVSGMIVMEAIVKKVIALFTCAWENKEESVKAYLGQKLISSLKYKEFVRTRLGDIDGKLVATPLSRGAGVVTSMLKADGIIEVPLNTEGLERGSEINVRLLRKLEAIKSTLVITGSHDPLIDELAELFGHRRQGQYISSSHVGSMGGIMAIKRGEAHLAAIHLLDEATGDYNNSYIKRYLAGEGILLVSCVKRMQGLMTAPGNPKNIKGFEDACREGIRYVNRQKGSGTRILLDYLLKGQQLEPKMMYGYEREEFTHMSVAALIANGSADTGLGIYSAARGYGLEFIPVCEECYEFILPDKYMDLPLVKSFIEVLESGEFRSRLKDMGGYNTENCGSIRKIL